MKRTIKKRSAKRRRRVAVRIGTIDVTFKRLVIANEPPADRDPAHLLPEFWTKLTAALADLAAMGTPFRFVEGFRSVDRQQWLYGSGRPNATPYGRAGNVVTIRDGVTRRSNHQGNGVAGSGRAADCYPARMGRST
jgi:hypothetical protein